ncbi:hypothetical protein Dsin_012220 [Dipteronia sinensis]|uniref:Uncharacterized protein n=1 Tax=Dipteronia sinensis TaxID=43782 RepID=A0AAE0AIG7_9ROSI|nr:hypothetical protein Dsin_012220 [Dipteronia sinensis]
MFFGYFQEKAEESETTGETPFTALPLLPTSITNQKDYLNRTVIDWEKFEYKILIWSIITEVSYYIDRKDIPEDLLADCKAIKRISSYMLYLLVKNPSMISAETGLMVVSFEGLSYKLKSRYDHRDVKDKSKTQICNEFLKEDFIRHEIDKGNDSLVLHNAIDFVT